MSGTSKNPSFYRPYKKSRSISSKSKSSNYKTDNLGWISNEQYEKSINEKPMIFNQTLTQNVAPYAVDYAINQLSNDFPEILSGGYKVFLTNRFRSSRNSK